MIESIKLKRPTAPKISNKLTFKQCKGPQTNIPQDVGRIEDLISKPVALTLSRIGDPRQINKLSSSLLIGSLWRVRNGFILSWFQTRNDLFHLEILFTCQGRNRDPVIIPAGTGPDFGQPVVWNS